MSLHWKWLRSRTLLVSVAMISLLATVTLVLWLLQPVTEANFNRIRVGMPQSELHAMLGASDYETVEVGLVEDPETYATNAHLSEEQKRERGFQTYQRQQWTSTEITIIVIVDSEYLVACRYRSEGRTEDPFGFVRYWLSRWF